MDVVDDGVPAVGPRAAAVAADVDPAGLDARDQVVGAAGDSFERAEAGVVGVDRRLPVAAGRELAEPLLLGPRLAAVDRAEDVRVVGAGVQRAVRGREDRPHLALSRVPEPVAEGDLQVGPRLAAVERAVRPSRGGDEHALGVVPRLHRGDDPAVEDAVEFVALEGDVVGSVQPGVCPDQQCHIRE